jgi:hypothetical protein
MHSCMRAEDTRGDGLIRDPDATQGGRMHSCMRAEDTRGDGLIRDPDATQGGRMHSRMRAEDTMGNGLIRVLDMIHSPFLNSWDCLSTRYDGSEDVTLHGNAKG